MTGHTPRHAIVIASGGLDSSAAAYLLADQGTTVSLLSFDYGQRHRRELDFAARIADQLGASHTVVDMSSVGRLLTGSALTDPRVRVPDGHYRDATMRSTVVPNRNAIMLDIAAGAAVAAGADAVAFGAHSGDHFIYPDCRQDFFEAISASIRRGNDGFLAEDFAVLAPFLRCSKTEVVTAAARLGVPFEVTWSCYRGGKVHCGTCGTCVERREAFVLAGVDDPTDYASPASSGAVR